MGAESTYSMREKAISWFLTDQQAIRILLATQDLPRSVSEICERQIIPIGACYRKIHELESAGLLKVVGETSAPSGKIVKVYHSLLKSVDLVYERGTLKLKFEFEVEKDINGKWVELNSAVNWQTHSQLTRPAGQGRFPPLASSTA